MVPHKINVSMLQVKIKFRLSFLSKVDSLFASPYIHELGLGSLSASSLVWASEASCVRMLSCLVSRASRAHMFHDIPQMESLFAG